jgi:hypothetical protein
MLAKMTAELIVGNPADVPGTLATLEERGFEIMELEEWIDLDGAARWFTASIVTEQIEGAFHGHVTAIVQPFRSSMVLETGLDAKMERSLAARS